MTAEVIVTLVCEHTDNGKRFYPGQEIPLSREDAQWLSNAVVTMRDMTPAQDDLPAHVPTPDQV